jgi:di/tricarboxylate transporter
MADRADATFEAEPRAAREALALAATAVLGAALGLLLTAASGPIAGTAGGCAAAAGHLCPASGVAAVKPYVTAALIGLLLGGLIAIAGVLVWREARAVAAGIRRPTGPRARPVAHRPHRPGLAPRAPH